jgi:hypothetical protein
MHVVISIRFDKPVMHEKEKTTTRRHIPKDSDPYRIQADAWLAMKLQLRTEVAMTCWLVGPIAHFS